MATVQTVLDLFDRLDPLDQLDRLMLLIGMPPQHQPPDTLSLFRRQDAIIAWAAGGHEPGLVNLAKGLEHLIERQHNPRPALSSPQEAVSPQSSLVINIKVLLDQPRDPHLFAPQMEYVRCRVGDAYSIRFLASHDCYLTVLCFGTTGRIYRLFPNPFHRDSRVRGAQTHEIPAQGFTLTEGGPPGTEVIRAFATGRPHFGAGVDHGDTLALYTDDDLAHLERNFAGHSPNDRAQMSCAIDVREGLL